MQIRATVEETAGGFAVLVDDADAARGRDTLAALDRIRTFDGLGQPSWRERWISVETFGVAVAGIGGAVFALIFLGGLVRYLALLGIGVAALVIILGMATMNLGTMGPPSTVEKPETVRGHGPASQAVAEQMSTRKAFIKRMAGKRKRPED